ncbi:MAG: HAD-IA family hydrolase [Caldimicrobium sp.]|nr:HAD-IA family hydrolase [Caldimicrobium sp.]MCX7613228.1 HAD-IA family hydrolase [Caldimicrobium sp.]MDW8182470.1 HAD-IA family hydrolase [Caldimicrobium sp.]
MIRAFFFDAEGTFLRFDPSLGDIYYKLLQPLGFEIDPEKVAGRLREAYEVIFQEELKPPLNGDLCKEAWRRVFDRVLSDYKDHPLFEKAFERVYRFFSQPECVKVMPGFRSFISELKNSGFIRAVITNWDCRLYPILEGHGLLEYFDAIFIGCEVGYLKPRPEIFQKALSHFNLKPVEVIMIGDSLKDDILPAQHMGMKTYHVKGTPDFNEVLNLIY